MTEEKKIDAIELLIEAARLCREAALELEDGNVARARGTIEDARTALAFADDDVGDATD